MHNSETLPLKNLASNCFKTVTKNNKTFNVSITQNIEFWETVESGAWEPTTFRIFDELLSSEYCYLDIGAWIGPTVLYATQLAKRAYAFEPDPIAYRELASNVGANKDADWVTRLDILNQAIASSSGTLKLWSRGSGGDSMSSALVLDGETSWDVEAIKFGQFIEAEKLQGEKLFLKIDIEGGEYELIPKLNWPPNKKDTILYLSIHPHFLFKWLSENRGDGIRAKILRRYLFIKSHITLIKSMPFKYFYRNNGKKVNLHIRTLAALFTGKFVTEIVATNIPWKKTQ